MGNLLPYQLMIKQLDDWKYELTTTTKLMGEINAKELYLVQKAISDFGMHTDYFKPGEERFQRVKYLNKYP